jgi:hypothetical protein
MAREYELRSDREGKARPARLQAVIGYVAPRPCRPLSPTAVSAEAAVIEAIARSRVPTDVMEAATQDPTRLLTSAGRLEPQHPHVPIPGLILHEDEGGVSDHSEPVIRRSPS